MYVKAWFTAQFALSARQNDLKLVKNIDKYKSVNTDISKTAKNSFGICGICRKNLLLLLFFIRMHEVEMKNKMVCACVTVCALEKPGKEHPLKRITLKREDLQLKELMIFYHQIPADILTSLDFPQNS